MSAELRAQVEALKDAYRQAPTDRSTAAERGRLLYDWVNAWAMHGGYVPVNATQSVAGFSGYGLPTPSEVDELIAELTLLDEQPQALGTLRAEAGRSFTAGSEATFTQTYTVGEAAVQTGGGFLIAKHFSANHAEFQTSDPAAANYISIASNNPAARFEVDAVDVAGMHGGFRGAAAQLVFRVAAGELNPGDQATITYGDSSGGGSGLLMPNFNSDQMPFPIYLDLDGSNLWLSLPLQPIPVVGGVASIVAGFAPSIVTPGESFEVSVRAADGFGNRATTDVPDWQLQDQDGAVLSELATNNSAVVGATLSFAEEGVYRLAIRSSTGQVTGLVQSDLDWWNAVAMS